MPPDLFGIDWGKAWDKGVDFLDKNKTALGVAGQIANQEAAVRALEGLGEDAKKFIGMPEGGLYNTIKGDTLFKPFNVSAIPGSVSTTAQGNTTYNLSPEQAALEKSLRTGGSSLVDAVLGRGQYGTLNPDTGLMEDDMRSEQANLINLLEMGDKDAQGRTYRHLKQDDYLKSYTDPFMAASLADAEQTAYDRLRAIRTPEEQRAQTALNQNLVAQGRQGLQTSQFGGSPEQFALSKAIEEQKSADAFAAMGMARQDAENLVNQRRLAMGDARTDQALGSSQRLQALQQQMAEKGLGADIAAQFLAGSYNPQTALLAATQPSLNIADIATTAGRQLGQYGLGLGQSQMAYDLGAQSAAANIRNQTMKGLFDLLIADKNAEATINAAAMQGVDSSDDWGFKIPSVFTDQIPPWG